METEVTIHYPKLPEKETEEETFKLVPRTHCKNCVFVVKHPDKPSYPDRACKLERLSKLKENGADIVWDGPNESYEVNGRFCSAYRETDWMLRNTPNNLETVVRKEMLIEYTAVVFVYTYDRERLRNTIDSLLKQLVKPKLITLALIDNQVELAEIFKFVESYEFDMKIELLCNHNITEKLVGIEKVRRSIKTPYMLIVEQGNMLDEELVANIDECINERMLRILFVPPYFFHVVGYPQYLENPQNQFVLPDTELHKIMY